MSTASVRSVANAVSDVRSLCKRTWWVFLIGGGASLVFGILAFLNPGIALFVLAMFFAASVLVDGAVNAWGAIQHRDMDGWWMLLLIGILGIGVGGFALFNPPVSMTALVLLVGFMALFLGILLISMGYKIRDVIEKEWLLYVAGSLSVLSGLYIFFNPEGAAVPIVWIIAAWPIATGLLRIWFAFKIRNIRDNVGERITRRMA